MSTSGIDSNRERDRFNRQLKTMADNQAKQMDYLKENQDRTLRDVEENHRSELKNTVEKSRKDKESLQENNQKQIEKLSDRFERKSEVEAKEYYDRFARNVNDSSREVQAQKSQANNQLNNLIASHQTQLESNDKATQQQIEAVRRESRKEANRISDESDDKLKDQAQSFQKQVNEMNRKHLNEMEKRIRENFESNSSDKATAQLRLEQSHNQHDNAEKNIKNAFSLREKQLTEEKNLRENQLGREGEASVEKYRERLTDNLNRVVNDNNFYNAKKDIQFSNQIAQQAYESQQKIQDQRLSFERAMLDQSGSAEAKRDRDQLQAELNRRSANQENYLNREAIKNYYEDAMRHQNRNHSATLRKQESDAQANFDTLKRQFQRRLSSIDSDKALDEQNRQFKNLERDKAEVTEHLRQREALVDAYETSQRSQEVKFKEQQESSDIYHAKRSIEQKRAAEAAIADFNMDNQARLSQTKTKYEAINQQLENDKKNSLNLLEKTNKGQLERTTENYQANLNEMSKAHAAQMESFKKEYMTLLTKVRAEDDAKLKETVAEHEFNNRIMAQDYESRITKLKQDNDRAMNAMKAEHERTKRDMHLRAKADLEGALETSKKSLALQESQFKEKMRIQDENHRAEIERLKRTNELLTQKS